jgi:hypothetical protein
MHKSELRSQSYTRNLRAMIQRRKFLIRKPATADLNSALVFLDSHRSFVLIERKDTQEAKKTAIKEIKELLYDFKVDPDTRDRVEIDFVQVSDNRVDVAKRHVSSDALISVLCSESLYKKNKQFILDDAVYEKSILPVVRLLWPLDTCCRYAYPFVDIDEVTSMHVDSTDASMDMCDWSYDLCDGVRMLLIELWCTSTIVSFNPSPELTHIDMPLFRLAFRTPFLTILGLASSDQTSDDVLTDDHTAGVVKTIDSVARTCANFIQFKQTGQSSDSRELITDEKKVSSMVEITTEKCKKIIQFCMSFGVDEIEKMADQRDALRKLEIMHALSSSDVSTFHSLLIQQNLSALEQQSRSWMEERKDDEKDSEFHVLRFSDPSVSLHALNFTLKALISKFKLDNNADAKSETHTLPYFTCAYQACGQDTRALVIHKHLLWKINISVELDARRNKSTQNGSKQYFALFRRIYWFFEQPKKQDRVFAMRCIMMLIDPIVRKNESETVDFAYDVYYDEERYNALRIILQEIGKSFEISGKQTYMDFRLSTFLVSLLTIPPLHAPTKCDRTTYKLSGTSTDATLSDIIEKVDDIVSLIQKRDSVAPSHDCVAWPVYNFSESKSQCVSVHHRKVAPVVRFSDCTFTTGSRYAEHGVKILEIFFSGSQKTYEDSYEQRDCHFLHINMETKQLCTDSDFLPVYVDGFSSREKPLNRLKLICDEMRDKKTFPVYCFDELMSLLESN